ncbi:MAG: type II secretion system F family protein [Desulfobacterales bacterium]|nr:type II secretion system F family protein [Desulfobacterales bacterium]
MLLVSYLLILFSIALLFIGFTQVELLRLENDYRAKNETGVALFNRLRPLIEVLAAYNSKLNLTGYEKKITKKLIHSGNALQLIPMEFLAIKELTAVFGALVGAYFVVLIDATPFFILICAGVAFFLPNLKLNDVITKRRHSIFLDLPFSMDLLTLAVEAGMTFYSGLSELVKKGREGPLQEELDKMLQEMRLGVPQRDALAAFSERLNMYEVRSFVAAVNQAEKLGAPLGQTLRTQSEVRRNERFQMAEKMAQEAPVKMLGPLALFIFPAVFIVILLPIFMQFRMGGF